MSDAPVTKITQAEFDALPTAPGVPAVGEPWREPSASGPMLVYKTGRWCLYGDEFITHRIVIVSPSPCRGRSLVFLDADGCKDEALVRGGSQ